MVARALSPSMALSPDDWAELVPNFDFNVFFLFKMWSFCIFSKSFGKGIGEGRLTLSIDTSISSNCPRNMGFTMLGDYICKPLIGNHLMGLYIYSLTISPTK